LMISWRGRARKAKKLMTRRSCGYPGLGHGRHRTTALTATTPSPAAFFFRAIGRRAVLRGTEGQTRQGGGRRGAVNTAGNGRSTASRWMEAGRKEAIASDAGGKRQVRRVSTDGVAWGLGPGASERGKGRPAIGRVHSSSHPPDATSLVEEASNHCQWIIAQSLIDIASHVLTRTAMPDCHGEPHFPRMITTEAFLPR
jgi:hypothetical protein